MKIWGSPMSPRYAKATVAFGYYLEKSSEDMWILNNTYGFGSAPHGEAWQRGTGVQFISVQRNAVVGLVSDFHQRAYAFGFIVPRGELFAVQSPEFRSMSEARAWLSSFGYDTEVLVAVELWAKNNRVP